MELFKSRTDCVTQIFQMGLIQYMQGMNPVVKLLQKPDLDYGKTWDGECDEQMKFTMREIRERWDDVYDKIVRRVPIEKF